MPSRSRDTEAGSTPNRSVERGISSGTSPSVLNGGGGGASASRQSGSAGASCAPAAEAARRNGKPNRLRRMLGFPRRRIEGGLRIRLERGAGRQLEPGARARFRRALVAVVVPGAHAAAQIAVAVVVPGQETRQFRERHLVDTALELHDHVERYPVLVPA